jgi:hypothetical protein
MHDTTTVHGGFQEKRCRVTGAIHGTFSNRNLTAKSFRYKTLGVMVVIMMAVIMVMRTVMIIITISNDS